MQKDVFDHNFLTKALRITIFSIYIYVFEVKESDSGAIYFYLWPWPLQSNILGYIIIMVITVRAHWYPLDTSPTAQAVWPLSWTGQRDPLRDVHYLYYASLTVHSLSTLVTSQYNLSKQCVSVHPVSQVQ